MNWDAFGLADQANLGEAKFLHGAGALNECLNLLLVYGSCLVASFSNHAARFIATSQILRLQTPLK